MGAAEEETISPNRLPLVIRIFVVTPLIRRTKRAHLTYVRVEIGATNGKEGKRERERVADGLGKRNERVRKDQ